MSSSTDGHVVVDLPALLHVRDVSPVVGVVDHAREHVVEGALVLQKLRALRHRKDVTVDVAAPTGRVLPTVGGVMDTPHVRVAPPVPELVPAPDLFEVAH